MDDTPSNPSGKVFHRSELEAISTFAMHNDLFVFTDEIYEYFVLADISRIDGSNSRERAMNLLKTSGVACVPGEAFYHDGSGSELGRFCFAKEDSILDEACKRIEGL